MKVNVMIGSIILLLIGFFGGYTYATKKDKKEMFRSVIIGQGEENKPVGDFEYKEITDKTVKGFSTIDNITQILMSPTIESVNVDVNKPDLYIMLNTTSDNAKVMFTDARVWFTDDGGIIGEREGETWEDVHYKKIDKSNVEYLKEVANERSK